MPVGTDRQLNRGMMLTQLLNVAEGLLLLTALTSSSSDLQKIVAFENAFDRIFDIIEAEGSLTCGGIVVEDCLSLLANLLRFNISNQSYFREVGGISKIARILNQVAQEQGLSDGATEWSAAKQDKNLWGLLSVISLFLVGGNASKQINQSSFCHHGIDLQILEMSFHETMTMSIRAKVRRDAMR